jgi:predicted Zn-dependent protease
LRSNLAVALIAKGDFKSAEKESDIAEKKCPHSTYTIWVGANSLAEQGNMNAAIAKLRAGLKQAPSCPVLREYLTSLLTTQGDTRAAKLVEEEGKTAPPPSGTACPTMPAK